MYWYHNIILIYNMSNNHMELSGLHFGLIELMNPYIHGEYNNCSCSPEWFVSYFNQDDEYRHLTTPQIITNIEAVAIVEKSKHTLDNNWMYRTHNDIPNYYNITQSNKYLTPSIFKYYINGQNVMCAIDKTFWLRILQRTIRRKIQERNNSNPNNSNQTNTNTSSRLYYSGGVWYQYTPNN